MTSRVPQLLITLTPEGALAVELPGSQATRRQVVLRPAKAGESLLRMLEAQARDQAEIGQDGAPTTAQVRHWERHSVWKDSRCRFCLAEGTAPDYTSARAKPKVRVLLKRDGVEVRKFAEGASSSGAPPKPMKTAEEIGL